MKLIIRAGTPFSLDESECRLDQEGGTAVTILASVGTRRISAINND